ncbi:WD40/YVTN/BNR-like repeat-containing protein [Streptomyces sp. bgisy100]|uniref:WD40/YVTN/BNR-like repeat-containing protein n=1 Tax=Streptomyces sp. bgisy100 TaxID=3413783 RepID=UPI003D74D61A
MRLPSEVRHIVAAGLCGLLLAASPAQADATGATRATETSATTGSGWQLTDTGSTARFRGLAAVGARTAWAAGSQGTVLRTTNGGRQWRNVSPPGAAALEFRDIEAFDARRAVVLAIGEGEASRILRTDDGGASWTETFRNTDARAFYDCMAFFDRRHGLALSDPVDGRYRLLSTADGGRSWSVLPSAGMPEAQPGDAAFAASGQCLTVSGSRDVWLATGGGPTARILHSADRGRTFEPAESTVPAGDPARGVFAVAFRGRHGIAVGGDYRPGQPSPQAAATSRDSGRGWNPSRRPPTAYRSGVTWLPGVRTAAIAVGPTGSDLTTDSGRSWRTFDPGSFDTVDCAPARSAAYRGRDGATARRLPEARHAPADRGRVAHRGCWAAGEKGRIARLAR